MVRSILWNRGRSSGVYTNMKWRRGLLFALIHIAIAVPLIVWEESRQWAYLSSRGCVPDPPAAVGPQEGWSFDTVEYWPPAQLKILGMVDLPARLLAGWQNPFRSKYTLAGIVQAVCGGRPRRTSEIIVFLGFTILIFLQWLVVGGLPFPGLERKWYEPSVIITLCAVVAVLALALPFGAPLILLALLIAMVGWVAWVVMVLLRVAKPV